MPRRNKARRKERRKLRVEQHSQVVGGATSVNKRVKCSRSEIIRYQIMQYCFIKNIILNYTELMLLSLLGELGECRVTFFCEEAAKRGILSSPQSVQTALNKLQRVPILKKEGIGKKIIYLDPGANILTKGNIVVNITLMHIESNGPERAVQKNSRQAELA